MGCGRHAGAMNACFDDELLRRLASEYGTPLWVMDAATIRAQA